MSQILGAGGGGITVPLPVNQGGTGLVTITDHAVMVGSGVAAVTPVGPGTNGELLIGSTGADPVWASVTSAGSTITITGGAGTLNLETAAAVATSYTCDAGSAVPALGVLTIAGGNDIATSGAGSTVTVALTGTTQYGVQVGDATGGIASLGVGLTAQVLKGNTGANPSWGAVDLTTDVSGLLPVGSGGTGVGSITAHALIIGDTTNPVNELAVGATNQVLLGSTGADPTWGTVPNAALTNSSITLSNGNNITITGSPVSLGGTATVNVSGTTQYAIQVGDATGSLDSLAIGTANQVLQSGGAGANPAWSTATYPATTAQGDVLYSSAANTVAGLTKNATATRYIANTGASNNPAWDQVNLANGVTGTLPVGNGGTGLSSITDHSLMLGSGAAAVTALGSATNGQLPIGSTGADPVLATITGGDGVAVTNGAGSISLATTGGGIEWTEVTGTSQAAAVNNGYIASNAAQVDITLPDTAALGSVIRVVGKGSGGWKISQNAGESIIWDENNSTTVGVGGSIESTDDYDTIEILCTVANTTWTVLSSKGNLNIT